MPTGRPSPEPRPTGYCTRRRSERGAPAPQDGGGQGLAVGADYGNVVTSTGVVFDGVAPPVVSMTCSITPTPPSETVRVSWKWMPEPVGVSTARSATTALLTLKKQYMPNP